MKYGHEDALRTGVSSSCFCASKQDGCQRGDKHSRFQRLLLSSAEHLPQTRRGHACPLREVAFVLSVCSRVRSPSPRLREGGFPHSSPLTFIPVNVEFYPTLLMYASH